LLATVGLVTCCTVIDAGAALLHSRQDVYPYNHMNMTYIHIIIYIYGPRLKHIHIIIYCMTYIQITTLEAVSDMNGVLLQYIGYRSMHALVRRRRAWSAAAGGSAAAAAMRAFGGARILARLVYWSAAAGGSAAAAAMRAFGGARMPRYWIAQGPNKDRAALCLHIP
jgi:hypothetical protein